MGAQLGLVLGPSSGLRTLPVSQPVLSYSFFLAGPRTLARPHLGREGREPDTEHSQGS